MTLRTRAPVMLFAAAFAACQSADDGDLVTHEDKAKSRQCGSSDAPLVPDTPTGEGPGSTASTNTVDLIVDDMRKLNDLELAGVPSGPGWATGPGFVVMGNDPRGTRTPSWWQPANTRYKSDAYWTVMIPWLVIFDGVGNEAVNTRVEMRGLRAYVKSKATGEWKLVDETSSIGGELYPKHLQGDGTTTPDRRESEGATAIKPPGGNMVFHGWGSMRAIDAPDVGAVFITVQARLVVDDPSRGDDRAKAKYLIHIGGDYYPDAETRVSDFAPSSYLPGIGLSRAKLVTSEWRSFNFATIDVGEEDPGGASITEAELRAAPPPLL